MRTTAALIASVAFALAIPQALGAECVSTTSVPEVDTGPTPMGRYYWDNDPCPQDWCGFWTYEESNGIDGLQRQDEIKDDTCDGQIPSDTIIF